MQDTVVKTEPVCAVMGVPFFPIYEKEDKPMRYYLTPDPIVSTRMFQIPKKQRERLVENLVAFGMIQGFDANLNTLVQDPRSPWWNRLFEYISLGLLTGEILPPVYQPQFHPFGEARKQELHSVDEVLRAVSLDNERLYTGQSKALWKRLFRFPPEEIGATGVRFLKQENVIFDSIPNLKLPPDMAIFRYQILR